MDNKKVKKWKTIIERCVEEQYSTIEALGQAVYDNPEPGFTEYETMALTKKTMLEHGLSVEVDSTIPFVCATLDTKKPGPVIAILGEMDCILCSQHPDANKDGGVHACGHHVQLADMVGCAIALQKSGLMSSMCGKIKCMAVPAEEHIQQDFRCQLVEQGKLTFTGGKAELVARGYFDEVDLAYMLHLTTDQEGLALSSTSNGCLIKRIRYIGKAAHAGGAPHLGRNALYAANIGLSAINSLRETFKEVDTIRVHPIITKGGDTVNVIPSDVHLGTYVRGKTMEAIIANNKKVDRACVGAALAMGCQVEIEDIPGYFPIRNDERLNEYAQQVAEGLTKGTCVRKGHGTGSTDMGDLSTIMPVIHPYVGGATGGLHSADFKLTDPKTAYGMGTKFLAMLAVVLMSDNAKRAHSVIDAYQPVFPTKKAFIDYLHSLSKKVIWPNQVDLRQS